MKKIKYELYKQIYRNGVKKCQTVEADLPTQMALEITRNCNLKCQYCPREAYSFLQDKLNISMGILEDIGDAFKNIESVIFCGGGEPFLNKDIYNIIDYIRQKNDTTIIGSVTNGTIPILEEDVHKLNDYKVNLVFSLDSMKPDSLRKGSNTVNIINNIKNVYNIKKQNNYEYPLILIVSILTTDGLDKIPGVTKFAIEMEAVSHNIEKINPLWTNNNCEEQRVDLHDPERVKNLYEVLYKIAENTNTSIEGQLSYSYGVQSNIIQELESGPCLDPWMFAVISANGMLSLCPNQDHLYIAKHNVIRGGRTEDQIRNQILAGSTVFPKPLNIGTLEELWNEEGFKVLRKRHINNNPDDHCQKCRSLSEHNSWFKCT